MFHSSHLPMHSMPTHTHNKKKNPTSQKSNPPQNPFKGIHEAPHALYKPQNPTKTKKVRKPRKGKHQANPKTTSGTQLEQNNSFKGSTFSEIAMKETEQNEEEEISKNMNEGATNK